MVYLMPDYSLDIDCPFPNLGYFARFAFAGDLRSEAELSVLRWVCGPRMVGTVSLLSTDDLHLSTSSFKSSNWFEHLLHKSTSASATLDSMIYSNYPLILRSMSFMVRILLVFFSMSWRRCSNRPFIPEILSPSIIKLSLTLSMSKFSSSLAFLMFLWVYSSLSLNRFLCSWSVSWNILLSLVPRSISLSCT